MQVGTKDGPVTQPAARAWPCVFGGRGERPGLPKPPPGSTFRSPRDVPVGRARARVWCSEHWELCAVVADHVWARSALRDSGLVTATTAVPYPDYQNPISVRCPGCSAVWGGMGLWVMDPLRLRARIDGVPRRQRMKIHLEDVAERIVPQPS